MNEHKKMINILMAIILLIIVITNIFFDIGGTTGRYFQIAAFGFLSGLIIDKLGSR